jgi:hypothetical protein
MAFYLDPNAAFSGDDGAQNLLGVMYRAEWDDWKARYAPYTKKAAAFASDTTYGDKQGAIAANAANIAGVNTAKSLQMQRAGMGLALNGAQQQAETRGLAVGRAADSISAYNQAKIAARDLQDQVLAGSGGMSNVPTTGMN